MIELALPWILAAAPLPLAARFLLPRAESARNNALRVPFFGHLAAMRPARAGTPNPRAWTKLALMSLAWLLLVGAAAQPRWVGPPEPIPTQGRDLMMALDISGSMARDDFDVGGKPVDRLSVVRAVAQSFLAERRGDRLGLILFGSRAYLQTPLTFDRTSVSEMMAEAEIGLAGEETAIGDAIGIALKHLRERPAEERVLVLLSDGANNAGVADPLEAASLAAESGIRIHTIGVGADRATIQTPFGRRVVDVSQDLDEETLSAIAERTGGAYFRARNTEGLIEIYRQIDELEPTEGDAQFVRPTRSLFHWPLAAAFGLGGLVCLASVSGALRGRAGSRVLERTSAS